MMREKLNQKELIERIKNSTKKSRMEIINGFYKVKAEFVEEIDVPNFEQLLYDVVFVGARDLNIKKDLYFLNDCRIETIDGRKVKFVMKNDEVIGFFYILDGKPVFTTEILVETAADLTTNEITVLNDLAKDTDAGTNLLDWPSEYESLFRFSFESKKLRGVLGSLVKKGYIEIFEEDYDNIIHATQKFIDFHTNK